MDLEQIKCIKKSDITYVSGFESCVDQELDFDWLYDNDEWWMTNVYTCNRYVLSF